MFASSKTLRLAKYLATALLLTAVNAHAVNSEDPPPRGGDNEYNPGEPDIRTVDIHIPLNSDLPPYSEGEITPSMIRTAQTIAGFMTSPDSAANCNVDDNTCNISNNPEAPIILTCSDNGGDMMRCYMPSNTYEPPFAVDCQLHQGQQSGDEEVLCTITSNRTAASEMLPEYGLQNNFGSVANTFLNCMYGSFGGAEAMCSQVINALNNGDTDLAISLLQSLAPLNPETAGNLTRDGMRNGNNVVLNRIAQLRNGTASNPAPKQSLYFTANQWLEAGARIAADNSIANDATPTSVSTNISDFGKLGIFINLNSTDGRYKDGSLASRSDFNSNMLTLGVDYRVRDDLVTGLAFNIGQSKTKYKSDVNGELTAESYSFIVYNSFYKNNWYFDTAITFGGDSYEQVRDPVILANSFDAAFNSMQYNLSATAGYDFVINAFSIAPFVQLNIGRVEVDGYNEKARDPFAAGVALSMDDQSRDIGMLNAGAHFRYVFTTNHGVFIPVLTLSAINDFENDAQVVTGRFIGITDPNAVFSIRSEESDSSYFIVGAGLSFQLKNGNAGFINLESVQGYSNLEQTRFTFGWRWEL